MARKKGETDSGSPLVGHAAIRLNFQQVAAALLRGYPLVVDEVEMDGVAFTFGSVRAHGDRLATGVPGDGDGARAVTSAEVMRMISRVGEGVVGGRTRQTAGQQRRSTFLDILPMEIDPNDRQWAPSDPEDWICNNVLESSNPTSEE